MQELTESERNIVIRALRERKRFNTEQRIGVYAKEAATENNTIESAIRKLS